MVTLSRHAPCQVDLRRGTYYCRCTDVRVVRMTADRNDQKQFGVPAQGTCLNSTGGTTRPEACEGFGREGKSRHNSLQHRSWLRTKHSCGR